MTSKFIDTNVFIEIIARIGKKSEKSKELLEKGKNLYTTSLVVSEVEWVMRGVYKIDREIIARFLKKILSSDIEIEKRALLLKTLNFYIKHNVDWTDCMNMFLVKEEGIKQVYSYDKGLNKFEWIERLEP